MIPKAKYRAVSSSRFFVPAKIQPIIEGYFGFVGRFIIPNCLTIFISARSFSITVTIKPTCFFVLPSSLNFPISRFLCCEYWAQDLLEIPVSLSLLNQMNYATRTPLLPLSTLTTVYDLVVQVVFKSIIIERL